MRKLYYILFLFVFASVSAFGQTVYKFDFSGRSEKGFIAVSPDQKYGNGNTFGFDFDTKPNDGKPFFFSLDVVEGNYKVTVVLGSKDAESTTTVKSESRRLMLENIQTAKGKFSTHTFIVNIRNARLGESDSVKIKPRERTKLIWDDKLTLEFNGENPSVVSIEIEKVDNLLTIFLAGDSTVVDENNEPWCGWGQIFPRFFTSKVAVANYAESGEAANSFVGSKRFAKLMSKAKTGDFLFIQFGHNDMKQKGEGKGAYLSYTENLKYLISEARNKGVVPVLVTSMHRRRFDDKGKIINTHEDYPDAARKLAKEEGVTLIDLNNMSAILYEAWGDEESKKAFVHYPAGTFPNQDKPLADNTHFNSYGAYEIAKCVLQGVVDQKLSLKKYIVKDFKGFNPAHPDKFEDVHIPPTPFSSTTKPDGN